MMQESLDRMRSRLAEVENELSAVRPATSSSLVGRSGRQEKLVVETDGESVEEQLSALSDIITDLREELITKEEMIVHERNRLEASSKEHAKRLEAAHAECSRLNKELAARPHREDVIALKKQLRVLHNVIFNAELEDDDGETEDSASSPLPSVLIDPTLCVIV